VKEPRWTVYCHIHRATGRRYVGLTKLTMMKRWNRHVYCAMRALKWTGTAHFPNAIRKYGSEAFDHEVLEVCDSLEAANEAEIRWIDHFDTRNPEKGFNLRRGGNHRPHPVKNPWDRPGFREAFKKLWSDPEFRDRIVPVLQYNMEDPEVRDRAVTAMKRSFARPESRKKRSRSSRAMWESDEYRARNAELWMDPGFRERCESGLRRGAFLNRDKTHCRNGHEFTVENTYVNRRGSRECRACRRNAHRRSFERRAKRFS